jgi:hypothetical protein
LYIITKKVLALSMIGNVMLDIIEIMQMDYVIQKVDINFKFLQFVRDITI